MAGTISDQKRIGIISEVDTSSAMVAVESRLSGLSIQLNGKVYPIGQIGTYVLVPVGKQYCWEWYPNSGDASSAKMGVRRHIVT